LRKIDNLNDYILLTAIFLFHSVLNIWYIHKDTLPPSWDPATHALYSSAYFHGFFPQSQFYPPFVHYVPIPFYILFGESFDIACISNIVFLAILLFSVYGIGKYLFNREVGLFSSLIISFIPILIVYQRDFLLDFPLTAMIALSIYVLLKSENLTNIKYSILFGICFGLAMLTKWAAIFFVISPLLWVFYQSIKEDRIKKCAFCGRILKNKTKIILKGFSTFCSERHKKSFIEENRRVLTRQHNLLFSLISFIIVAGSWYIPNYKVFFTLLSGQKYWGSVEGDPVGLSLSSLWYYIEAVNKQAFLFLSILFLVGLIYLIIKVGLNKKILFTISILFPYISFVLISNKDVRYTLPLLIFLSIALAYSLINIENKKIKSIAISILIVFCLLQTSTITFGYPSFDVPNSIYPTPKSPIQEDWKIDEVLSTIQSQGIRQPNVLILYDSSYMNWRTLQYYVFINQYPINIQNYEFINAYPQQLENFDFVLYVDEERSTATQQKIMIDNANMLFEANINNYIMINSINLSNKKQMEVYQRK